MSYSFSDSTHRLRCDATFSALGAPPASISYTLACWVKVADATPTNAASPFSIGRATSTSDFITQLRLNINGTGGCQSDLLATTTASTTDGEADAVNNTWFLIVGTVVVDASSNVTTLKAWTWNGTAESTQQVSPPAALDNLLTFTRAQIGEGVSGVGEIVGEVAHCAIWTKELDASERTALATTVPSGVAADSLAYYWPLLTGPQEAIVGSPYDMVVSGATLNSGDGPTLGSGAVPVKYVKVLVGPDAASASDIEVVVHSAPSGTDYVTGTTRYGSASGYQFEASLESGQAVLKVLASTVGCDALDVGATVAAVARNGTYTSGVVSATIIEE